ncbi:MAG TPA: PspC domain-containing protein [Candidatus Limnocylindria bacterium]
MTSQRSERTGAPPRILRRRTRDRVLGGVAGGLGDYFNIDPLLLRIGFVGLMIFGGAGLVLYVVAWLLIPADGQDASSVESFIGRLGLTPSRIGWILLAFVVIVLISNMPIGGPLDGSGSVFIGPLPGLNPAALWALGIILVGIVLLRSRESAPAISPTAASADGLDQSPDEGFMHRLGLMPLRAGVVVLIVGVVSLFLSTVNGADLSLPSFGQTPQAFWAVAIIAIGVLLLRRRGAAPSIVAVEHESHDDVALATVIAPPRPRSPLALYACAAVLLSIGLLAIVSQTMELSVGPGQFFGAALTVIGIGLIVGAWWGRARILILLALLLLPVAVGASFITTPLEGGVGDHHYVPVTVAELKDEYRSLSGRTILDLQDLQTSPRDIHIAASVAMGQLVVILPEGASVELRTRVGAGDSYVLGSSDGGTSLDNRYIRRHLNQTTYVLDLEVGVGEVFVTNSRVNW